MLKVSSDSSVRHGVKVGPGPRDLGILGSGTRDPPQSLKVGPETPLKFKSGTLGPPSKFKSRIPGPPSKFQSGAPAPFFNEFIFSEYFIVFYFCVFFK